MRVPRGVRLDPGGIGKGLAADLVAATVLADGAAGAVVDVGGDVRVAGTSPASGWRVDVDLSAGPATDGERATPRPAPDAKLALRTGGVATSSTRRRAWTRDGTVRHHLIDPATGAPAATRFVAATVVAGTAWWAEALTKAVLLADSIDAAERTLVEAGGCGLAVDRDGRRHTLAGVDRFLR